MAGVSLPFDSALGGPLLAAMLVATGCLAGARDAPQVRELALFDDRADCDLIAPFDGTAADQASARALVRQMVTRAGGNAVAFVGARQTRDPDDPAATLWTERALIYCCPSNR